MYNNMFDISIEIQYINNLKFNSPKYKRCVDKKLDYFKITINAYIKYYT